MEVVAVIDFETTGLSPDHGDRATEVAAVLVRDGKVVDRYQSLMNASVRIHPFITELTGITDAMIRKAPPAADVMRDVSDFVGDHPLVAHNASFDRKFWDAELGRIRRNRRQEFACSMLVARRVFPQAPSHKLGVLVEFANLPVTGRYHRALADAEMAASLLVHMEDELRRRYNVRDVSHELLREIQKVQKHQLDRCMERYQRKSATAHVDLAVDDSASLYVKTEEVEVAFAKEDGELVSLEGPNRYQVGDALITGSTATRWSVSRSRFEMKYEAVPPTGIGEDGRYKARPMPVLAKQIAESFTACRSEGGDVLRGNAGDWLLQYAPGDFGIAENSRFVQVYRRLKSA